MDLGERKGFPGAIPIFDGGGVGQFGQDILDVTLLAHADEDTLVASAAAEDADRELAETGGARPGGIGFGQLVADDLVGLLDVGKVGMSGWDKGFGIREALHSLTDNGIEGAVDEGPQVEATGPAGRAFRSQVGWLRRRHRSRKGSWGIE